MCVRMRVVSVLLEVNVLRNINCPDGATYSQTVLFATCAHMVSVIVGS